MNTDNITESTKDEKADYGNEERFIESFSLRDGNGSRSTSIYKS